MAQINGLIKFFLIVKETKSAQAVLARCLRIEFSLVWCTDFLLFGNIMAVRLNGFLKNNERRATLLRRMDICRMTHFVFFSGKIENGSPAESFRLEESKYFV